MNSRMVSQKTVERLAVYRRILEDCLASGKTSIHSHELATRSGSTPPQVRRDLMQIKLSGTPRHGYKVKSLLESIIHYLTGSKVQRIALVGAGNLGRALLSFFSKGHSHLAVVAAFDSDPAKYGRVVHGCHCYHTDEMERVIEREKIQLALICVPASEAQKVAERLVDAGVKGLTNFSALSLRLPPQVYVEDIDLGAVLEKVAYFATNH